MLAYVFWHRPAAGVERDEYEAAQRAFHGEIGVPSACFRVEELPFAGDGGGGGYEDWYLVDGWAELGELNQAAVDARQRPSHDRAAALLGSGWAGVYRLLQGVPAPPDEVRWLHKQRGMTSAEVLAGLGDAAVWQRQMVLGPAPEFCVGSAGEVSRRRVC